MPNKKIWQLIIFAKANTTWYSIAKYCFSYSGFASISLVDSLPGSQQKTDFAGNRTRRMLNVLEVIRFPNNACTTENVNISGSGLLAINKAGKMPIVAKKIFFLVGT